MHLAQLTETTTSRRIIAQRSTREDGGSRVAMIAISMADTALVRINLIINRFNFNCFRLALNKNCERAKKKGIDVDDDKLNYKFCVVFE